MGYGTFVLPGETEERGYNVLARCEHPFCLRRVDKGLGCLCARCQRYFCGRHLYLSPYDVECYAPEGTRWDLCVRCLKATDRDLILALNLRTATWDSGRIVFALDDGRRVFVPVCEADEDEVTPCRS